jgi:hypothetical protein
MTCLGSNGNEGGATGVAGVRVSEGDFPRYIVTKKDDLLHRDQERRPPDLLYDTRVRANDGADGKEKVLTAFFRLLRSIARSGLTSVTTRKQIEQSKPSFFGVCLCVCVCVCHRELRERMYRHQVFVVHRHKRVLRRVRHLPVLRLLDLSPRRVTASQRRGGLVDNRPCSIPPGSVRAPISCRLR